MRRRRLVGRRDAHQPGDREPVAFRGRLQERIGRSGSTPAFCGSAPVLTSTNRVGCRPCRAISLARASPGSAGRPNGSPRTAPPPPWPCSTAAARPGAARCRDAAPSAPATWPWPPARGSRRTRVWPAAMTGAIASTPKVLEIATKVTEAGSRCASASRRDLVTHLVQRGVGDRRAGHDRTTLGHVLINRDDFLSGSEFFRDSDCARCRTSICQYQ